MPLPTGVLVGRACELAQIDDALQQVAVALVCGVPGIGKSTLALAYATQWQGPAVHVKLSAGASLASLTEAIYRRLGVVRSDLCVDDAERLDELWTLLDELAVLLVVDDLHCLAAPTRAGIVGTASQRLRIGRVLATSRELVPISADMPDHLQLRLEGLDRTAAALLWERLEALYGPGGDFETAWQRSLGNPYLLRQAHAATLTGDHPLVAIARSLDSDQRRVAGALALSHVALPRGVLERLCPTGAGAGLLQQLVTRLIIEVTAESEYAMHDLMREAIVQALEPVTVAELRATLIACLAGGALDAVTTLQETARHLRALGRHEELARLLVSAGGRLISQGANTALLHELDSLPSEVSGHDIQLLRARTLARSMQPRRAYQVLGRLIDQQPAAPTTCLFFAACATMIGALPDAERTLRSLIDDSVTPPDVRTRAEYGLLWVATFAGRLDEVLEIATRTEGVADSTRRMRWSTLRMLALALRDQGETAADVASEVTAWLEAEPLARWSHRFTPSVCAILLARVGRLDEADRAMLQAERGLYRPDDHPEVRWGRAMLRFERGQRGAALEEYRSLDKTLDRSGYLVGAVWTRCYLARLLFLLGRRREAMLLLDETIAQCRAKGAFGLQRIAEVTPVDDPLGPGWLNPDRAVPRAQLGSFIRHQVRNVLRDACGAKDPAPIQDIGVAIPAGTDYAFDRALLELARAIVATRSGRDRVAAEHVQRAVEHANECQADPDLIPALYDRLRSSAGSARQSDSTTTTVPDLVIDGLRHEIRDGEVRVALSARVIPRRLLYAFVAADGHYLDRDAISRALWTCDYDPLRHSSSVHSNIRRLRSLLEGTRLVIQTEENGYRLNMPPFVVVISPNSAS